jgi:hypothetical protein
MPNLAFHHPQVILTLKIQPKLGLDPKIALQPERCISGYASFAVDNLTYSIRRYGKIPRQLVYADVHWFHEILSQDFTRRNRIKKIFVAHYCTSMIVDDFDVEGVALMPFKTDSPLLVDADCILSFPVASESVKHVSWIQHQRI